MELWMFHHDGDSRRSTWTEWLIVALMLASWHSARAWLSSLNGKEAMGDLMVRKVNNDKAQREYRNEQHGLLGIVHCCGVVIMSSVLVVNAWGHNWSTFLGLLAPNEPDFKCFSPFWPIAYSFSYFISDLLFIFDFPVYLAHHLVSCALLFFCVVIVDIRFTGVITLLCAEVGGIMLSVYVKYKTLSTHIAFCVLYAASRVAFTWFWYNLQIVSFESPRFADDVCSALVLVLVLINWHFWYKHFVKLMTKLHKA